MITAAEATGSDPLTWLVNLGIAGVVLVLLITGQLRTRSEVDNLKTELDRRDRLIAAKDQQVSELTAVLTGSTLPAIARSTRVLEALPRSETALYSQLRSAQRQVAELSQQLSILTDEEQ